MIRRPRSIPITSSPLFFFLYTWVYIGYFLFQPIFQLRSDWDSFFFFFFILLVGRKESDREKGQYLYEGTSSKSVCN